MPKFALLSSNVVSNLIIADSLEVARHFGDAVEYDENTVVNINYIYDKETNTFSPLV